MLVLWGRARSRDYFDVAALLDRYGPDRLLELAATKTPASPSTPSSTRYAPSPTHDGRLAEDGVSEYDADRLRAVFDTWRSQLTSRG